MARPPQELLEAAKAYVPVRVVNMAGVDLNLYVFDYDLTFAVLLMNGDGTIYHRYGTRDHTSGMSRLSMASLVKLLKDSLEDHRAYQKAPKPPKPPKALPRRTIEDIPPMARKIQKKKVDCFHCHMVNEAERDWAREEKRFSREAVLGQWPLPEKVGLKLGVDEQTRVVEVLKGSPAERAGIRPGDEVRSLGGSRVRTQMDVQWALHNAPAGGSALPVELLREGDMVKLAEIRTRKGWKLADELELSWRSSMWGLRPRPGFGGRPLTKEELEKLGLEPDTWAFKVGYIVDWGEEAYTGQNARKAGIKNGDVVVAVGGKRDFASELHFQSWFRFTRKPGTKVPVEILRDGKRTTIELPVVE
ncbi:MAG: PDZ domain-containing protein [Planctomycetes bacterium]|nr:PDZ domain-containing protein [Planctomycetota bacterium]